MANCGKDILIAREGTEQQQRFVDALSPDSVKLNDFGLKDWMNFAFDFASHINYFNTDNAEVSSDNWQSFFKSESELESFLDEISEGNTVTPHLALFVAFVKLINITKLRFNKLTKRHLDFYFKQVLNISKQAATPDLVHVVFELAKNATSEKIEKKTELDGGKDADSKKLVYKTIDELVANQTKVALLKTVYNDFDCEKLKIAAVADSYDGEGEDFPDDDIKWWPFGYYNPTGNGSNGNLKELADAQIGFALSGEIFELQEGERNVEISVLFNNALESTITGDELENNLEIYCTGEKGWIESITPKKEIIDTEDDSVIYRSGLQADKKELKIAFQIPREMEAVVSYDSKTHGETFSTNYPVCRILINTEESGGHKIYQNIVEQSLEKITVNLDVRGVEGLTLSNDTGTINADKPFYPFGTQPVKKSKFYIDYPELYKKKWSSLNFNIEWKNTPDDFKTWYYAYRDEFTDQVSKFDYLDFIYDEIKSAVPAKTVLTAQQQILALLNEKPADEPMKASVADIPIINPTADTPITDIQAPTDMVLVSKWVINDDPDNLIVEDDNYFTAEIEFKEKEEWDTLETSVIMFDKQDDDDSFEMDQAVSSTKPEDKNIGPIRLSLNNTFKHEMYPRLYALAMSSEEDTVIIPNEPYTPYVERITVDYKASAEITPNVSIEADKEFELYHEHPFGQAEECVLLKDESGLFEDVGVQVLNLVPAYKEGGGLYIGLENAIKQQTVSLLVQVLEGSENPEAESFANDEKVEWSILCGNYWQSLTSNDIILDETGNFLTSGLFKFSIPSNATDTNTLLPDGYMWLRAKMSKKYDAVSMALGIHAQAVSAEFADNDNNLKHLVDGLTEETISKMVTRLAKVKGVSQPYSSFNGKPEETNEAYYRRISERLRHKNRAITLWDYEHLILQNFPEIYKAKCLNHTCIRIQQGVSESCTGIAGSQTIRNFLAPGRVVVVVIPDIVNKNVFDIYKPRVSQATLNNIQEFLNKKNAQLVQAKVINPSYEELKIDLKVSFRKGYDQLYYESVLREDLTRLLSPWAFDRTAAIQFGLSLHKSVIINYVEKLGYVDFVSNVKLFQTIGDTETEVNVAMPSSPEAILVSSKEHIVAEADNYCLNQ